MWPLLSRRIPLLLVVLLAHSASLKWSALFVFDYPPEPETFVIELLNEAKTAHARRILSGAEQQKIHVSGIVVKDPHHITGPGLFICHHTQSRFSILQ
jgi:hypothetical protein